MGGHLVHSEDQIEKENQEKLRKNKRKFGKFQEIFLSCPPEVEGLDASLLSCPFLPAEVGKTFLRVKG